MGLFEGFLLLLIVYLAEIVVILEHEDVYDKHNVQKRDTESVFNSLLHIAKFNNYGDRFAFRGCDFNC